MRVVVVEDDLEERAKKTIFTQEKKFRSGSDCNGRILGK